MQADVRCVCVCVSSLPSRHVSSSRQADWWTMMSADAEVSTLLWSYRLYSPYNTWEKWYANCYQPLNTKSKQPRGVKEVHVAYQLVLLSGFLFFSEQCSKKILCLQLYLSIAVYKIQIQILIFIFIIYNSYFYNWKYDWNYWQYDEDINTMKQKKLRKLKIPKQHLILLTLQEFLATFILFLI